MEDCLALFFTHVSQLCFDKGQELIEKEKEICKSGPYKSFLGHLSNLISAERFYINLGFVTTKSKLFMRKDNSVRTIYESLRTEFYRLEESCSDDDLASIACQAGRYITTRIQLIEIYEKMYLMGTSNKAMKYDELLASVETVMDHSFNLTHVSVTALKTAVSLECEIVMLLLQAQIDLQNWRFLPTLLDIHGASTRIAAWEKSLQNRESWKLGFGASFLKGNALPPLLQWLVKLKFTTINKFTLYFHHSLQQQTNPLDFRALCSKNGIDSYQRLQSLQRKHDAMTVLLIFSCDGATDFGPSYQLPNKVEAKPPDSHMIMVHCPINLIEQLPTLSKAIKEKASDLAIPDRVVCCYSVKDQSSYFMTSVEPRVTLVFVFDSKKDEKDTTLCKHIAELGVQLRNNGIFAKLKLNS